MHKCCREEWWPIPDHLRHHESSLEDGRRFPALVEYLAGSVHQKGWQLGEDLRLEEEQSRDESHLLYIG